MFSYIKQMGLPVFLRKEILPMSSAWVLAELFYKFGSFTLECLCFLVTWFGISWMVSFFSSHARK